MGDPFRSDLEAARRRIEQLEAEHEKRVGELEEENRQLRARLVERSQEPRPRRRSPARVVLPIAMLLFGASLGAGMLVARQSRPAMTAPLVGPIQLQDPSEAPQIDFDRSAAAEALSAVRVQDCAMPNGPTGPGHVRITFAPGGQVIKAEVDPGHYSNTPVGSCVEERYRAARVPAFSGSPVTVAKSFDVE